MNASTVASMETDGLNPPLSSGLFCSKGSAGPSFSIASDAGVFCASVTLTKSTEDVSAPAEGDLEGSGCSLDLCPLGSPGTAAAPHCVPDQASSTVTMRFKKTAALDKSPFIEKKTAPGNIDLILRDPIFLSSLAIPTSSFQNRSQSAGWPLRSRPLRSVSCLTLPWVENDGFLVVLYYRKNFTGDASSWPV